MPTEFQQYIALMYGISFLLAITQFNSASTKDNAQNSLKSASLDPARLRDFAATPSSTDTAVVTNLANPLITFSNLHTISKLPLFKKLDKALVNPMRYLIG